MGDNKNTTDLFNANGIKTSGAANKYTNIPNTAGRIVIMSFSNLPFLLKPLFLASHIKNGKFKTYRNTLR
jgi:hypothetical protein